MAISVLGEALTRRCGARAVFASATPFIHLVVRLAFSLPPSRKKDVCIEFLVSHMRRNLNAELYRRCLDVVQRLLCYEKRHRVRLTYQWQTLWAALVNLFKFLLVHEEEMMARFDVLSLANQIVNIFNLFVTFGDTFLPDPTSYDELYYELIRERKEFDQLYETGRLSVLSLLSMPSCSSRRFSCFLSLPPSNENHLMQNSDRVVISSRAAKRYMREGGPQAETAGKLASSLINIRAIINHFSPKIDAWSAANKSVALSPEHVLSVVRDNYDTLTLKLQVVRVR
jgi:hypothetical protein